MLNIWWVFLILFGICLLLTLIGFKKFVYFLSLGYGLSIAFCGIALIILFSIEGQMRITPLLACVLFILYGFRLSGFLLLRELKNASYRRVLKDASKTEKPIPIFVLISIWISVALLYVMEVSGVVYTLQNTVVTSFWDFKPIEVVGLVLMMVAIILESIADSQKTVSKKKNPNSVAMTGLYRICRCPNYYGEILFWTGVVVFSLFALSKWYEWVIVLSGYLLIVYVMLNGAKRLEKRQDQNYGSDEKYLEYTKKTPLILYLFIPIYHLRNSKIIK